jgi:protein arginine N-methyltransferase 1
MYNVSDYAWMVADPVRVSAYAAALQRTIKPGSVVVEIGTGVGVFAVLAKQLGAGRVIAIEPSNAISVGSLIARQNGVGDGVEFIHGLSADLDLPGGADVVFADVGGKLPLDGPSLQTMIDARQRLLAPGGTLIPAVHTLYAAVVESADKYASLVPSFDYGGAHLDLSALRRFTTNRWQGARFSPKQLLTGAEAWARIDYRTLDDPNVEGTVHWTAARNGLAHGLAVWFDAMLVDGVTLSNAPGQPELVYGKAFFPWSAPVDLREGDRVSVRFRAQHVAGDYVWRWDSQIRSGGQDDKPAVEFRQSTFLSDPPVRAQLRKRTAAHVATLTDQGKVEAFILHAMDGTTPNDVIGQRLLERFPTRFARLEDAIIRVGDVAERFGVEPASATD